MTVVFRFWRVQRHEGQVWRKRHVLPWFGEMLLHLYCGIRRWNNGLEQRVGGVSVCDFERGIASHKVRVE